jgi:catechol-2,3-dioxygenase
MMVQDLLPFTQWITLDKLLCDTTGIYHAHLNYQHWAIDWARPDENMIKVSDVMELEMLVSTTNDVLSQRTGH